jgi:hypothetical protein
MIGMFKNVVAQFIGLSLVRHCEERSDEAIWVGRQ